jgi:exopolyphosphatase/guanosine-5'-triphosphate,3'-diphosphate pyrophosphatase
MAAVEPRYEFRIWGDSLDQPRRRLTELSRPGPPERSQETYIVSDATDATNAKIRAGAIDIKLLLRVEQGLEQWRPYLKSAFPLDASLIGGEIFASLRVEAPPLRERSYSAGAFVDELIRPHARLAAAEVRKQRWRFVFDDCAAEFVEATIEGGGLKGATTGLHSVAIESANAPSVLAAIDRLGLGAHPNISYVRQIKSILGRPSGR